MANVAFFLYEKGRVEVADELQHELIKVVPNCLAMHTEKKRKILHASEVKV